MYLTKIFEIAQASYLITLSLSTYLLRDKVGVGMLHFTTGTRHDVGRSNRYAGNGKQRFFYEVGWIDV